MHRISCCLPTFALAVCLAAGAAPAAGALEVSDVGLKVHPAAPATGEVVEVSLTTAGCDALKPAAVEVRDDGVVGVDLGVLFQDFPCQPIPGPSFALGPLEAGTYRVQIRWDPLILPGSRGPFTIGEIAVADHGTPPLADERFSLRRLPAGQGELYELEALVPFACCDLPRLGSVEYDGSSLVRVYLEMPPPSGGGLPAIFEEQYRVGLGDLEPGFYTVILYLRRREPKPEPFVRPLWSGFMPFVRSTFGLSRCTEDPAALCLGGRFEVRARWATQDGAGSATPLPLTADSGAFWFFRPDNLELVVKVLDACSPFGRYWVFISGLTNVGVEIEVVDLETGESRTYGSSPGEGFAAIRDTDAFATCP